jgi:glyoxylase-like metal-dependent hydrolase (beta-lactamase superfamily II)
MTPRQQIQKQRTRRSWKRISLRLVFIPLLYSVLQLNSGQADPAEPRREPSIARGLFQPDARALPDLFVWTETCNVYVLRDGDAALLVDLGDGSVLNHLQEIGVKRVEWVLFTHHHREQCQGFTRLKGSGAKVAAPAAERALFERPSDFRKMKPTLGDAFTVYGSSYVRPPNQPVPLDRTFSKMDTFNWRGHEFWCVETRGNSPGGMSYFLKEKGSWLGFSGDVMLDGARMHTWFDTEWDYGFASGIYALHNSAALVESFDPAWLLPSHGPVVRDPKPQLRDYQKKLRKLERLLVRGYEVNTFSAAYQDTVSRPSSVPHVWEVSPHLFKFKGPDYWPNFGLILSDSGHGLVVDCGLLDETFLDRAIEGMREKLGLKQLDAVIITHMHGDHFLEVPHLREKWVAQVWALDRMAPVCEHPERFDYAAAIQTYGRGFDSIRFDRLFKSGETFDWEGFKFTVDWMPGQTEFALCLHGVIDGRKVAFTGDNLFGDPTDPSQGGHEAVVAHNSAVLEEGYILAGEYLHRLQPDLIVGGHSYVMNRPAQMIERFRRWAYEMRDAFQAVSSLSDYRYWFDPFWVRAEPYRVTLQPGESAEVQIHVRNFHKQPQRHRIEIHAPPGLVAEPSVLEAEVGAESRQAFPVRLKASPDTAPGVNIVALDVSLDAERYGEWFDFIVNVEKRND